MILAATVNRFLSACASACASAWPRTRWRRSSPTDEPRLLRIRTRNALHQAQRSKHANRTLLRQVRNQGQMVASLAHELRSPLRGLLGAAELLAPGEADPDRRRLLEDIRRSSSNMLRMTDDSLEWTRLQRRQPRPQLAPFRLDDLLADVLAAGRPLRREAVALVVDLAPDVALHWDGGDAQRLRQILTNLVCNSLAYTRTGHVLLSLRQTHDALEFSVSDTGPGIPPRLHETLFAPFVQGAEPGAGATSGRAGMGLAIAAALARSLAGTLELTTQFGEGARFALRLPLTPIPARAPRPLACGQRIGLIEHSFLHRHALIGHLERWGIQVEEFETLDELQRWLGTGERLDGAIVARELLAGQDADAFRCAARQLPLVTVGDSAVPPGGPLSRESLPCWSRPLLPGDLAAAVDALTATTRRAGQQPLRILIVDDHPLVRRMLGQALHDLGCTAIEAASGAAALQAAAAWPPFAMVLLDRNMPGLDGLETARGLRSCRATRHARLVLLVNDDDAAAQAALEAVDAFMVRPHGSEALRQALAQLMREHRASGMRAGDAPDETPDNPIVAADLLEASLREDLGLLASALAHQDRQEALNRVHRMHGALRFARSLEHQQWLDQLRQGLANWQTGRPAPAEMNATVTAAMRAVTT